MSNLTVMVFEDKESAGSLREAIRQGEKMNKITVDDAAIVIKDSEGNIQVKHETDRGIVTGIIGGSTLGLLLGSVFFPLAGLVTGAIGGAIVAKIVGDSVDREFANEVAEAIEPGSSALFVIGSDSDLAFVRAILKPFKGEIYHTTLDSETQEAIQHALSKSG